MRSSAVTESTSPESSKAPLGQSFEGSREWGGIYNFWNCHLLDDFIGGCNLQKLKTFAPHFLDSKDFQDERDPKGASEALDR